MSDTIHEVVNTIGQTGTLETSQGNITLDDNGEAQVTESQASEIKDKYPYLEVVRHEQHSKTHPMRISQWPGVPWHKYDDLGRIIHDLESQSPPA